MTETKAREWHTQMVRVDILGNPLFSTQIEMIDIRALRALQKEREELKKTQGNLLKDQSDLVQESGFLRKDVGKLKAENAELRAEVEGLRSQRDQLHKILKEKNLAKEIDEFRTPKGFQRVEAYSNGSKFIILGEPDESHNCDQMGCGSLDHVIFRSSYLESERDTYRATLKKLCEALEGQSEFLKDLYCSGDIENYAKNRYYFNRDKGKEALTDAQEFLNNNPTTTHE